MTPEERHERVLRQWAAKVINLLPADDNDSRQVLKYASQLLENFLAVDVHRAHGDEVCKRGALN